MANKEYIDRDAITELIRWLDWYSVNECGKLISGATYEDTAFYKSVDIYDAIKKYPSANVVEVVRCKECKYWQDNNNGYPHPECRWGNDETPDADDYCSYGERKDNDSRKEN